MFSKVIRTACPLLPEASPPPLPLLSAPPLSTPLPSGNAFFSSRDSLGPPPAPRSPCLCVPAPLEPDAVITSAVKGFVSLVGREDAASTANGGRSLIFRASLAAGVPEHHLAGYLELPPPGPGCTPIHSFSPSQHPSPSLLPPASASGCPQPSGYLSRSTSHPRGQESSWSKGS